MADWYKTAIERAARAALRARLQPQPDEPTDYMRKLVRAALDASGLREVVEALASARSLLTTLTGPDDAIAQAAIRACDAALARIKGEPYA